MNRKMGRKKYWIKQRILVEFNDTIFPNVERLKQCYIRKNYGYFYKAVENSRELTWSELYAHYGIDYDHVKRQPNIWTAEKLIAYMKGLIENGDPINLTALSQHQEHFYKAIKRSKEITEVDLYARSGADYYEVNRQKRYKTDKDARVKLMSLTKNGIQLYKKYIQADDNALYQYLLERGKGSLDKGIENVGYKYTKNRTYPRYKIFDLNFLKVLGYRFEDVVSYTFSKLKTTIKDNNETFKGCKPDFIDGNDGTWYDAKLTTLGVNRHIKEGKYALNADKVIYIYLVETEELISPVPINVIVYHVEEFVQRIKDSYTKGLIKGRLHEIEMMTEHSAIDTSLMKLEEDRS